MCVKSDVFVAGIPLKTTMDHCNTVHITGHIHNLVHKARNTVRELDSQNDLTFLRLRSKKHEIMCAPGKFSFSSSFEFHQTANQTCQLVWFNFFLFFL